MARSWTGSCFPGVSAQHLLDVQAQGHEGDGTPGRIATGVRDELVVAREREPADDLPKEYARRT